MAIVEFGTNRLRYIVARAYTKKGHAVWEGFYRSIRDHPLFASPAAQIFEIHALLSLWHYNGVFRCTCATANFPSFDIPSYQDNLKFFYRAEELKDIAEPQKPICLVPTSGTFPTLDAVILTPKAVITVQISIALKHDATEEEFDLIYKNLPHDLLAKRPNRHHVFITDDEINAKSLREQNQTQIPNGTLVYSAVIGVSTSVATEERVDALEKARVSMSWLCAIWYLLGNMQAPPSEAMGTDD